MAAPAITGVADNSEEPGAPVAAAEGPEVSEGPQGRLLHDVVRNVRVTHQPAREPVGSIEMWKHHDLEALCSRTSHRTLPRRVTHRASPRPAGVRARAWDRDNENRCPAAGCSRTRRRSEDGPRERGRRRDGSPSQAGGGRAAGASPDARTFQ